MFPMVPYHQLPALHERLKHDFPTPNSSMLAAYKEIIPALLKQRQNPDYFLRRELPASAQPYKEFVKEQL
jgi:fatty acid desaturase